MRQAKARDFLWLNNTPREVCRLLQVVFRNLVRVLHPPGAPRWRATAPRATHHVHTSSISRSRMSRSRLAKLSHAQLVELAAEACEGSPEIKNKADALIAQVAPLPSWCVDILS